MAIEGDHHDREGATNGGAGVLDLSYDEVGSGSVETELRTVVDCVDAELVNHAARMDCIESRLQEARHVVHDQREVIDDLRHWVEVLLTACNVDVTGQCPKCRGPLEVSEVEGGRDRITCTTCDHVVAWMRGGD